MTDALTEPTQELPVADTFPAPPTMATPPRRKPGPAKGSPQRGGRGRSTTTHPGAPPRRATPNKPAAAAAPDYAQGVVDLIEVPQGLLAGYGLLPGKEAYLADAAVVNMLAPVLGDAAAKFAEANPSHKLVGYLDKAITVGPYALLGTAVVTGLAQIAVNHGLLPAGLMGTKHPRLLALRMKAAMMAAAEQQAAQQAHDQAIIDALAAQMGDVDEGAAHPAGV